MLQKIHLFFSQAPTHRSFTFNSRFYTGWSKRFISLKVCGDFRVLISSRFYWNLYFFHQKPWILWLQSVIIPFKIKIIEKPHTQICSHLQEDLEEDWKSSDICVSWCYPETDLETNFLNLETTWIFENVSFSQL